MSVTILPFDALCMGSPTIHVIMLLKSSRRTLNLEGIRGIKNKLQRLPIPACRYYTSGHLIPNSVMVIAEV